MKYRTITVKIAAPAISGFDFKAYEFPEVKTYLEDGWQIKEISQLVTNTGVPHIFITYILNKH